MLRISVPTFAPLAWKQLSIIFFTARALSGVESFYFNSPTKKDTQGVFLLEEPNGLDDIF